MRLERTGSAVHLDPQVPREQEAVLVPQVAQDLVEQSAIQVALEPMDRWDLQEIKVSKVSLALRVTSVREAMERLEPLVQVVNRDQLVRQVFQVDQGLWEGQVCLDLSGRPDHPDHRVQRVQLELTVLEVVLEIRGQQVKRELQVHQVPQVLLVRWAIPVQLVRRDLPEPLDHLEQAVEAVILGVPDL